MINSGGVPPGVLKRPDFPWVGGEDRNGHVDYLHAQVQRPLVR